MMVCTAGVLGKIVVDIPIVCFLNLCHCWKKYLVKWAAPILTHQHNFRVKAVLPVAPKIDFLLAVIAPYELTFFVFSGFMVCRIRCPDTSNQLLIRSVFVLK